MIDTHLHFDDAKFDENRQQLIDGLAEHGIDFVINNSCDLKTMLAGFELAKTYERVFATVGMHPHEAKTYDAVFAQKMAELAPHPKVVAVGEIGLDYYYDLSERSVQRDVFAAQLEIADKLGLPVNLHIRDAYGDAADILTAQNKYLNHGVLWHCYSGSAEFARQMAKKGHYFAFGGAITFKNAKKEDVLAEIPLAQILSETDSPYMAPVPYRGTVNTPYNIPFIIAKMAEIYKIPQEKLEERIRENTLTFFPKIREYLK